ncbi:Acetyltransferase (GNAT) domain-containing protein [Yoonia rosea]|uniref:Acetyltransferase (GNAT) domain-containing protein n=2 Tax=Yoonia rosea TaxID=287098 RepID=A0A1R3WH19_9RHOB|nr:Acetyltransferase (GNAT) domain-containing protein [Yoonia rosea]
MISEGMHDIPAGHVPAVVTYLEMSAPAITGDMPFPDGITATREVPTIADYRALFRAVGAPWLWSSRLMLDAEELSAILARETTEVWVIRKGSDPIGLVELAFQGAKDCELAYFGIIKEATGQGLGGPMMALAQSRAFARNITRFYVHTCNWDDPRALRFYQKAGFVPYKIAVEVFSDPRCDGIHPETTAPHVPLIK